MAVKIRLARRGRRKKPFYHIVVADARAPRDGKFIENIGSYNPMTKPATIDIDRDKALEWLMKGAQPTDTARAILRFKGVMYRKHLMRGVSKGAMTQEQADKLYHDYIDGKEAKVAARAAESKQEKIDFYKALSGKPGQVAAPVTAAAEELAEFQVEDTPAVEAEAEATPAAAVEAAPEAPVAEEAPAPVAEDAKVDAPADADAAGESKE